MPPYTTRLSNQDIFFVFFKLIQKSTWAGAVPAQTRAWRRFFIYLSLSVAHLARSVHPQRPSCFLWTFSDHFHLLSQYRRGHGHDSPGGHGDLQRLSTSHKYQSQGAKQRDRPRGGRSQKMPLLRRIDQSGGSYMSLLRKRL